MLHNKIRLLLAENHELLSDGLIRMLSAKDDLEVVDRAHDGEEVFEKVDSLSPDVVIISLMLPLVGGVPVVKRISKHYPQTHSVILSPFGNEAQLRESLEAGSHGFLIRQSPFDELIHAIYHASRGDYYLPPQLGKNLVSEYIRPIVESRKSSGAITQREREIAILFSNGYSTKEAAELLHISPKTAETHRASIMKKLSAKNVTDVVKYCIRNKLIEP
ncbi:MAG: response regulator [candidate division Zixibacteria bacterium]|nr:response regulator [candidate division Zixibacteria bacterium]